MKNRHVKAHIAHLAEVHSLRQVWDKNEGRFYFEGDGQRIPWEKAIVTQKRPPEVVERVRQARWYRK